MACISAETGTYIFAIINIVLSTFSSASSLGLVFFWSYRAINNGMNSRYHDPDLSDYDIASIQRAELQDAVLHLAYIIVLLLSSLTSLLFASFLMNGIRKKKPEHMKVYYIFGMVKMILFSLFVMVVSIITYISHDFYVFFVLYCLIYSLILYMIRSTYLKFQTINEQFCHKPLAEAEKC